MPDMSSPNLVLIPLTPRAFIMISGIAAAYEVDPSTFLVDELRALWADLQKHNRLSPVWTHALNRITTTEVLQNETNT